LYRVTRGTNNPLQETKQTKPYKAATQSQRSGAIRPHQLQQTNKPVAGTRPQTITAVYKPSRLQEAQHIRLHLAATTTTPLERGSSEPSSSCRKCGKQNCI